MYKYAINTAKTSGLCDCNANWREDLGWTEEMYTGEIYKCILVECPYTDAVMCDFDYEDSGDAEIGATDVVFNKQKYLERVDREGLERLRNKRYPLLQAFDKYNISVTRGIIQETNNEKTDILAWYRLILDLNEDALNNPPNSIKYFIN